MHHTDAWWNIHHRAWGDYINIKDISVVWGENVASAVYQDVDFENSSWTCWAHWPDGSVRRRFNDHQFSNNHLLADRPRVQQAILSARPGDEVRMRGMLVEYSNQATRFLRGTSVSREDSGRRACETVYVENFKVRKEANPGWRTLFNICKWFAHLSGLCFLGLLAVAPVRRRAA